MEPLILILDDDRDFSKAAIDLFGELGVRSEVATDVESFVERLKQERPAACLIDIDIIGPGVGLTLVKAIRKSFGSEINLFVSAGKNDRQVLAHAIEKGADDCLIKPIDPEIAATKLSRYFRTEGINFLETEWRRVPGGSLATLAFDLEMEEIDELGVKFRAPHLIAKGTVLEVDGDFFEELDPSDRAVRVVQNWINSDRKSYGAFAEFEQIDGALKRSVRSWLVDRLKR